MTRGGKRDGAGRKSRFSSPTTVMRIPEHLQEQVRALMDQPNLMHLPLYSSGFFAGFPLSADDHIEARLDLNEHLIKHPSATFFVRANGESMLNAGIHNGDLLVVDHSLEARKGHVVIVALDGELMVKRLDYRDVSGRVMQTVAQFYPELEIYSVDECFVHLTPNIQQSAYDEMQNLRRLINQWTGIPVSIGIAPTKTLAKLANIVAKKQKLSVLDASSPESYALMMQRPVGDVWGIGRRWQAKLLQQDIETVADLCQQPRAWMRQNFSVVGLRLLQELHDPGFCASSAETKSWTALSTSAQYCCFRSTQ